MNVYASQTGKFVCVWLGRRPVYIGAELERLPELYHGVGYVGRIKENVLRLLDVSKAYAHITNDDIEIIPEHFAIIVQKMIKPIRRRKGVVLRGQLGLKK